MAENTSTVANNGADETYAEMLADPTADPNKLRAAEAAYWAKELSQSRKWMQKFQTSAKKVEDRYMLDSSSGLGASENTAQLEYNMFWSNVQTLLSIVYGRLPTVEVNRAHQDAADDVARVAGIILERIFNLELKNDELSPHTVYQEASRDLFIAGMGIAWARYEFEAQTETKPPIMAADGVTQLAPEASVTIITNEFVPLDYIRWSDFAMSPCRTWTECRWVGRRVKMTKGALIKRFGKAQADQVPMGGKQNSKFQGSDDPSRYTAPTAEIWELWDKENKRVCWYSEGMSYSLESKPDPLQLSGFFPMKAPLRATNLPRSFLPKADYLYLRQQYDELDMLGARMSLLSEAIRVIGIYDKSNTGLKNLLGQAAFNQMIPVDNWAMFAEKGGIKGVVDWFPVDAVVAALEKLSARKAEVIADIYQIYGINDVMRGTSQAGETATSQRLKTQFGSARLEVRQEQVAGWITGNMRMRAEIVCRHWDPQTIIKRSAIEQTPDAKFAQQAVQLLKGNPEDIVTRLTVSADTISSPDWQLEQQQRVQYLQAVGQFVSLVQPLVDKSPGAAPFLVQMLQWGASGFKGGKQIEGVLDQALAALAKDMGTPKPPPPPSAKDKKDEASAIAQVAGAKKDTADAMKTLAEIGIPPIAATQLPPQPPQSMQPKPPQGMQPPGGMPPGGGGMPPRGPMPPGGGMQQMPGQPNNMPPQTPGPGPMGGGRPV